MLSALTKPADPLPSAHLAAGAGIVAAGKLRVEQAATGLVKKVITPAGEVGTEILGVSAAALARAASLTVGFLLLSNNSKDDPGYQGEWDLDRKMHHLPPPDPDKARLAALEAQHAQGTLTAEEEAELIALLAKVKGIRVQRLDELNSVNGTASSKPTYSGQRPQKPEHAVLSPDGSLTDYGKWYYERPYHYRRGVRKKVFDGAKEQNGKVHDPLTRNPIEPDEKWDMGHKPGYEFRKHQLNAAQRRIGRKQFVDEHNEHSHYRPELPSSNRSHQDEDLTNLFLGGN